MRKDFLHRAIELTALTGIGFATGHFSSDDAKELQKQAEPERRPHVTLGTKAVSASISWKASKRFPRALGP